MARPLCLRLGAGPPHAIPPRRIPGTSPPPDDEHTVSPVLVSLTLARNEVPLPIALRLFLPESWTNNPERMARAGVPEAFRAPRSKPEVALSELDRVLEAGVRFGIVVADAGYGISAAFRQALSARGLRWAVGIPRIQKF